MDSMMTFHTAALRADSFDSSISSFYVNTDYFQEATSYETMIMTETISNGRRISI